MLGELVELASHLPAMDLGHADALEGDEGKVAILRRTTNVEVQLGIAIGADLVFKTGFTEGGEELVAATDRAVAVTALVVRRERVGTGSTAVSTGAWASVHTCQRRKNVSIKFVKRLELLRAPQRRKTYHSSVWQQLQLCLSTACYRTWLWQDQTCTYALQPPVLWP